MKTKTDLILTTAFEWRTIKDHFGDANKMVESE